MQRQIAAANHFVSDDDLGSVEINKRTCDMAKASKKQTVFHNHLYREHARRKRGG